MSNKSYESSYDSDSLVKSSSSSQNNSYYTISYDDEVPLSSASPSRTTSSNLSTPRAEHENTREWMFRRHLGTSLQYRENVDSLTGLRTQSNLAKDIELRNTEPGTSFGKRFSNSAPLCTTRLLSSNTCTLNIIEEDDESKSNLSRCSSSSKYSAQQSYEQTQRKITPRQKEVPPKRRCIRNITTGEAGIQQIDFPNSAESISNKFNLTRNKGEINVTEIDIFNQTSIGNVKLMKNEDFQVKSAVEIDLCCMKRVKTIHQSSNQTWLPHSVVESGSKNTTLEPNIIILDDTSTLNISRPEVMGDAPLSKTCWNNTMTVPKNVSRPKKSIFSTIERCFRPALNEISPISTSTCVLLSSSSYRSSSVSYHKPKLSKERTKSKSGNHKYVTENVTGADVLKDFAEGVEDTREHPVNFEDVEVMENEETSFRSKALELMKAVKEKEEAQTVQRTSSSDVNNPCLVKRMNPKGALLIDVRKEQCTDLEYYRDVCFSSSEDIQEHPKDRSVSHEINVDVVNERNCCSCFRFLRFN